MAIVGLCAVADALVLIGARGAGIGWGSSLLMAWAGGAALAVTGLLTAAQISLAKENRGLRRADPAIDAAQSSFRTRRQLRDTLAQWDADRQQDRATAPDTEISVLPDRAARRR
ncbi:hypothetical protein BV911_03675 [Pseudoruegeria sp. SK021]|nr:hypothetical protein BV911_03675 [Pseudoruegeria sp. SK021]